MYLRTLLLSAICSVTCFVGIGIAAPRTEREMSARVDALLAETWAREQIQPSQPASDAEFLRRVTLDLTGIIPKVLEVREFLGDSRPDKRSRLIERLLNPTATPRHATHFANIWRNIMLPPDTNVQRFGGDAGFQSWLREQFANDVPYDKMVTELLVATGAANQTGPALFYTALELKPEDVAASTSRIFLGTQIQCAQCHDHPFDHWKRKDFWGYAAFFARLQRPARGNATQVAEAATGEVKLPDSDEVVPPQFLGGDLSGDEADATRRQRLAAWLTSADNAYFARATVNRVWALLFGRGIVEPVDDFGKHNPPSHPQLLDELAEDFVASGFDVKRLIRTLANTNAYQLSSESLVTTEDRPALFARMAIKTLTAEQLYDCLYEGMRVRDGRTSTTTSQFGGSRGFDQNKQNFLNKFRAPTQGATEYQAGIPQALTLMNGAIIRQATDLAQSDLLIALEAPFFTDERRVEILFLSTLSRMPHAHERERTVSYVEKGGTTGDRQRALGDVLWALLNSAEFILNH